MGKWKKWGAWSGLLGTAVVVWVLNHILDLTASGALRLWGGLITVATLGSHRLRDAPFEAAALNPYPMAALHVYNCYGGIILSIFLYGVYLTVRLYREVRRLSRQLKESPPPPQPPAQPLPNRPHDALRLGRRFLVQSALLLVVLLAADSWVLVPMLVNAQAVSARQLYESNRDIVAPYLTPADYTQLQADFAAMETKAQYLAIMNKLSAIAAAHHVKLHRVNL